MLHPERGPPPLDKPTNLCEFHADGTFTSDKVTRQKPPGSGHDGAVFLGKTLAQPARTPR